MSQCESCKRTAKTGERFCGRHRSRLLTAMKRDGYLTPVPKTNWNDNEPTSPEQLKAVRVF